MPNVAQIIDDWIATEIRGVTLMTRNTEAYNHMTEAAQRLKAKLTAPADPVPEPEPEPFAPSPQPDPLVDHT